MEFTIRVDYGLMLGVYGALAVFGIGFNALIAWMEKKGYMEGFTSLLVALGVAITLLPFLFFSPLFILIIAGGFLASGLPMIIGSLGRYAWQRKRGLEEIARLHDGDESKGMAGERS